MLTPECWRFEWIEAWFEPELLATSFPDVNMARDVENTNYVSADGHRPVMLGDSEGFRNRTTYARPGGCYYSARLTGAGDIADLRQLIGTKKVVRRQPRFSNTNV